LLSKMANKRSNFFFFFGKNPAIFLNKKLINWLTMNTLKLILLAYWSKGLCRKRKLRISMFVGLSLLFK
jgi:hypothetical protein